MHTLVWLDPGWVLADQAGCSCGWVGPVYWDGADLAKDQWEKHVAKIQGGGKFA